MLFGRFRRIGEIDDGDAVDLVKRLPERPLETGPDAGRLSGRQALHLRLQHPDQDRVSPLLRDPVDDTEPEHEEDSGGDQQPETQAVALAVRPRMGIGQHGGPLKLVDDLSGARKARRGVLLQAALDDPGQDRRGVGARLAQRRRLLFENHLHQLMERVVGAAQEGWASREHLVQHGTERPEIGAGIDLLAAKLLRSHIGHGPHGPARIGQAAGPFPEGEPEVEQLEPSAAGQHQVGRLEIAVDDAGTVGRLQGRSELGGDGDDLGEGHGRDLVRPVEPLLERLPLVQRHDEEGAPLVLAHLLDLRDVRVVQGDRGPGLAAEAVLVASRPSPIPQLVPGEELESHLAAGLLIESAIDHAHATAAEQAEDTEMRHGGVEQRVPSRLPGRCAPLGVRAISAHEPLLRPGQRFQ